MKIIKTEIPEVLIIELDIFKDDRGFFVEKYNQQKFAALGINTKFVQDNHSRSKPKVLRGLHYQVNPSQAKLVSCLKGRIQDIVVDIRPDSANYKKYVSVELSADNARLLYIPAGFAHGFCVLGEEDAEVTYKVDEFYSKEGDRGIIYNDPELDIKWQIEDPILSEKDKILPRLSELK